ncbi:hypothetical protein GCM10027161_69720 [Microbispora hainanensis]
MPDGEDPDGDDTGQGDGRGDPEDERESLAKRWMRVHEHEDGPKNRTYQQTGHTLHDGDPTGIAITSHRTPSAHLW